MEINENCKNINIEVYMNVTKRYGNSLTYVVVIRFELRSVHL